MGTHEPVDFDALEPWMRALSYASRLELVSLLRRPHVLHDIRLAPRQVRPGENAERLVSRQTLQAHLDKLVEVGLVTARDASSNGRRGKEYATNPQRFYQVLEEFRKIGMLAADAPSERWETVDLGAPRTTELPEGPKLLLVRGLAEGRVYPLDPGTLRDERGWILGRKEDVHVSLAYDPYVSLENAEIVPSPDGGCDLLDLRSSKNGTWLNWHRLDRGGAARLVPGDVIGVGRSALVFRAE